MFGRRRRPSKAAEKSCSRDRRTKKAEQPLCNLDECSPTFPSPNVVVDVESENEFDFFFPIDEDDDPAADGERDPGVDSFMRLKAMKATKNSMGSPCPPRAAAQQEELAQDLAVSFLEDFFFGGSSNTSCNNSKSLLTAQNFSHERQQRHCGVSSSMDFIDESLLNSPTSTIIPDEPICSCHSDSRVVFSGLSKVQSYHNSHNHQQPKFSSLSERTCLSLPAMARRDSCNSIRSYDSSARPKKSVLKQQQSQSELQQLSSSKHRNVSFTDISVREYDVELSDHPSCSYGPPIQLGWDYLEEITTSVEDYEVTRTPMRRDVHELVLSYNARKRRLKQIGYNRNDIKAIEKEVDRVKRERLITEFFLPASAIDETVEKVFLFLKDVFVGPFKQQASVCQVHNC